MQRPLTPEFSFAGFTWPRYVATLAQGLAALRRQRDIRRVCGGYFHAPRPNDNTGRGFYLGDAGQPAPRWEFTGAEYYCDSHCSETLRGIILRLPHGRFLAGYSMGEGMASGVDSTVYHDEDEARHAADEEARIAATRLTKRPALPPTGSASMRKSATPNGRLKSETPRLRPLHLRRQARGV